jgi:hypothetical protein
MAVAVAVTMDVDRIVTPCAVDGSAVITMAVGVISASEVDSAVDVVGRVGAEHALPASMSALPTTAHVARRQVQILGVTATIMIPPKG